MKLTGKCKVDFEEWLCGLNFQSDEHEMIVNTSCEGEIVVFASDYFDVLPIAMQYGVMVDFFDSAGIEIGVVKNRKGTFNSWCTTDNDWDVMSRALPTQNTRPEARIKAIEKSNEFYNNL
ncbi:hypothetical protein [Tenacibaculum finnmarkense]|uniref:hypothetical protein n=1 Tax=Tenacibaculum finnmarkense TaxID=2781243 RepID=UPI001EFBC5DE|nr:hypothetical protein [Tenacibaculum finnmarkense]MCG8235745.1 hypothetical protein [Tenacibaculum finnmarkense genomovar ulcerans]MCG8829921.1 hypothetical protein [Tenacibaculum finnmarkense]